MRNHRDDNNHKGRSADDRRSKDHRQESREQQQPELHQAGEKSDKHNNDGGSDAVTKKKAEGYGLIGTSLSDRKHDNAAKPRHDHLGPNRKLLATRREEVERERQSRLDQGKRAGDDGGGNRHGSREERERALEEMERSARDRDRRF